MSAAPESLALTGSMYNALNGVDDNAARLLQMLNISSRSVPRFRDCYVKDGYICILTRTGGGNRDAYADENLTLCCHAKHFRNSDCAFDNTYAEFFFTVPLEHEDEVAQIVAANKKK